MTKSGAPSAHWCCCAWPSTSFLTWGSCGAWCAARSHRFGLGAEVFRRGSTQHLALQLALSEHGGFLGIAVDIPQASQCDYERFSNAFESFLRLSKCFLKANEFA